MSSFLSQLLMVNSDCIVSKSSKWHLMERGNTFAKNRGFDKFDEIGFYFAAIKEKRVCDIIHFLE